MRLYGISRKEGSVISTYVPSDLEEQMELLAKVYIGGRLVREVRVPAENYLLGDAAMSDFMRLNRKIRDVLRSLRQGS